MTPGPETGIDYHVNYRGPTYLAEVWYLCGAYDNLADAQAALAKRIASDLDAAVEAGSEWRLVAVYKAEIVAVIEHMLLTGNGVEAVAPRVDKK